jgi:hypothetical protein
VKASAKPVANQERRYFLKGGWVKILLTIDDSKFSEEAVRVAASRPWPPNTLVRVLSVVEPFVPSMTELWYDAGGIPENVQQNMKKPAALIATQAAE